jgi:pentatricopeptide repeat protein
LEWVKEVHSHALEAGFESDVRVGNALVHMYAKSGSIEDARLVFDRMEERNGITWNAMIGGLAQHGLGHEALELFRKMDADGVKPDECSFVAVLSACSHAGLLDDGHRLFAAMTQDYGIEPTVVHCTCMVDLLGRAGFLEEAKVFICNMPVEPNEATWGALLGACRTYGNVELGELSAKEILKLEPMNPSTYVLLSNIYAAAGKWEEVSMVRSMMQERGIRKEPGRSWIEVDDKIHRFVVGDTSHPEAKQIYAELNRLTERIKAEGYIPDTRLVLENIDEEDKELALCSHSEKLAIAYGLIHMPHGKPIRVYKNLRVCSDCHTATKFISKVTGREIVARDANRFHHFNDGVCSCGDYW